LQSKTTADQLKRATPVRILGSDARLASNDEPDAAAPRYIRKPEHDEFQRDGKNVKVRAWLDTRSNKVRHFYPYFDPNATQVHGSLERAVNRRADSREVRA
jgi:hypothetical protein